jgi:hypothetical protein
MEAIKLNESSLNESSMKESRLEGQAWRVEPFKDWLKERLNELTSAGETSAKAESHTYFD